MEFKFTDSLSWYSLLCFTVLIAILKLRRKRNKLPPGPPGWPIVGNIFDLGTYPHQGLYQHRFKYGPVIWLRLGFTNTLVIQSAKAAGCLFKNHDVSFSGRIVSDVSTTHNFNQGSLSLCSYGPTWRKLRRLVTLDLTTNKKVNESVHVRKKCVDKMIQYIEEDTVGALARGESGEMSLSQYLLVMTFNLIGNLIFSRDLVDSHNLDDGSEFFDAMDKVVKFAGAPNMVDSFPFLRVLDPQRIKKNMEIHLRRAMNVVEKFMKERTQETESKRQMKDFLDSVMEFKDDEQQKMSPHDMLVIILEMFFAGTETTSGTIEWVLAELFHNSESMERVKEELDQVVGPNRKVEEGDLDELPYLQAVIKETMRLHPVLPFVPRNTIEDTEFMDYLIPKNTNVIVNAWAIGRDPDVWEDPLSFKPERFVGSEIDYKGHNFELIPFGSGRRRCVGMGLGHRIVHLTVASLIHSFDWQPPNTVDMREKLAFSIKLLTPLKAIPKKKKKILEE